jgi:hypothetical protein
MLKPGMRVEELTKKVGQVPRYGKVKAVHGESIEVQWEDDHISIVSRQSLHATKEPADK